MSKWTYGATVSLHVMHCIVGKRSVVISSDIVKFELSVVARTVFVFASGVWKTGENEKRRQQSRVCGHGTALPMLFTAIGGVRLYLEAFTFSGGFAGGVTVACNVNHSWLKGTK